MTELHAPKGLLHALLLDGKGGSLDLGWNSINSWKPEQGCLWLHFNFEEAEVTQWLHGQKDLNELVL